MDFFALPYELAAPPFDESQIPATGDPERYVRNQAEGKATSLLPDHPERAILTADTAVVLEDEILGKPANEREGFAMLARLAGVWHTVYTAVCVAKDEAMAVEVARTRVQFRNLTPDQIRRYQQRVMGHDKAGAYAIQGPGGLAIKGIEGCFYNVMGLPIQAVHNCLLHVGIDLWDYLGQS